MMETIIKILCLEKERQTSELIKDVYNSIPHQLKWSTDLSPEIKYAVKNSDFNLIVVDCSGQSFSAATLQTMIKESPKIQWVVIEEDQYINDYNHYKNLQLISSNEISSKLPPILAESYQKISDSLPDDALLSRLFTSIIDSMDMFIAVVRKSGEFIYLNRTGGEKLGLADAAKARFQDVVSDGLTVLEYLIRQCLDEKQILRQYKLSLKNEFNQISTIIFNIRGIQLDDEYILLQEQRPSVLDKSMQDNASINILNQFAQSIANELLNPINVISGRLQMLKGHSFERGVQDADKSIEDMQKQVLRINETISKLVAFSSLKEDVVPQKIHAEEILKRISLEPSIARWLEKNPQRLQIVVRGEIPVLMGLISHFDLLLKILVEAGLEYIGPEGTIRAEVCQTESEKHATQVKFSFLLTYSNPIFGEEHTLCKNIQNKQTIEGTIIDHIIHTYHGTTRCGTESPESEYIQIFFPVYDTKKTGEV